MIALTLYFGCGSADGDSPAEGGPVPDTDTDTDADTASDTLPVPTDSGGSGLPGLTTTIEGVVFRFQPTEVVVTDPPGFGDLIRDRPLLVQVLSETAAQITLRFAAATDLQLPPTQDRCVATFDSLPADWTARPNLHLDLNDAGITFGGAVVTLHGGTLDGTLDADGFLDIATAGEVDTRELVAALYLGDPPETVCELLAPSGVVCAPCSFSGEPYCIEFASVGGSARPVKGVVVTERTPADISADPGCP